MLKNIRFRTKEWYDDFWKNQPLAFGKPNEEISKLIVDTHKTLNSKNILHPRVIDIGSGNGRYISVFQALGFQIVTVDISETACKIIKDKINKNSYSSAEIICSDYLTSDYLNNMKFDFVFSSGYLEEVRVESQKLALSKMKNMTLPGGFVLIKYCLEITNRGQQVKDGFVESQFNSESWKIIYNKENKKMKDYPQGVLGENSIRTGLLYAQKY